MVGLTTGCTASAETTPTATPTPTATGTATSPGATPTATPTTASPRPSVTRPTIQVQLNPDRVTAGQTSTVWILANCPLPSGGPAHTGTATSTAFVSGATLDPVPSGASSPTPTAAAGGSPWVRGSAQVGGTIKRGTYTVNVKCDGTNDMGTAQLRVVSGEALPTNVPTRAPRAGGGGTYAQDASDESSIPLGPAGVLIALALAGGIAFAVKRRNRA
ncbi:hypothetical protein ACTWPT_20835 [Nonomuraea sp. 3N208]|uniref:hypothetical protein n=1 Tax=Nonomuraea sp. 3N208 TaxID=3457421 RepID=UPI003FCD9159